MQNRSVMEKYKLKYIIWGPIIIILAYTIFKLFNFTILIYNLLFIPGYWAGEIIGTFIGLILISGLILSMLNIKTIKKKPKFATVLGIILYFVIVIIYSYVQILIYWDL